jgi:hypothetical protein
MFTLRATSPCKPDGSIPREIDAFFKSVRQHPLWLHDFVAVDITNIKRGQTRGATTPSIDFTIVCSPQNASRTAAPPPPSSPDEGKKEHK